MEEGGEGKEGCSGVGESFKRSGRRCRRHSQSPRAAQSRRECSERASEQVEGAPGPLSELGPVVSAALRGPEGSERLPKSAGAELGESSAEAPVPLHRLLCQPGSARPPPCRPRACSPGPRCPRDGLGACKGLGAPFLSRALCLLPTDPSCAPRRPRPEKLVVRAA